MPERKSIMRSLGEFFGHIAHGLRADPSASAPQRTVLGSESHERHGHTPDGRRVMLRRTVIEEVEVGPPAAPAAPGDDTPAPDRPPH